jgi:lipopolysaccharide transport protein LptA
MLPNPERDSVAHSGVVQPLRAHGPSSALRQNAVVAGATRRAAACRLAMFAALMTTMLTAVVPVAPAAAASLAKCTSQIEVEGDNLDGNLRKNFTELKNVTISGCDARIEARVARFTKLDFEDSRWTFEGDVRIRMDSPPGNLNSDLAIVSFRNNQLDKVDITGKPARFQQKRTDSNAIAYGRAGRIVYELGAGTVNLMDNAWVCDGSKELRSAKVVYDLNKQLANASSGSNGQRVKLTIDPRASKDAQAKKPDPTSTGSSTTAISCTPPDWNATAPAANAGTPAEKPAKAP